MIAVFEFQNGSWQKKGYLIEFGSQKFTFQLNHPDKFKHIEFSENIDYSYENYCVFTDDFKSVSKIELIDGEGGFQSKGDRLLRSVLDRLQSKCNQLIRTFDGRELRHDRWIEKSQNMQDLKHQYLNNLVVKKAGGRIDDEVMNVTESEYHYAVRILNRKDRFRKRYKILKEKILKMNVSELEVFNPEDMAHWAGVEDE